MTNRTSTSRASRPGLGFTLIELIVAIGAVALIAVGIATVFESVGRTVAGGRRVSNLNQYAALIERQMRADFESMTRDGVLLVRHAYALEGNPVSAYVDDTAPRRRRIDELLFFATGEFSSARSPVVPGVNARASEAMIHYGHGMRLDPIEDTVGRNIGGGAVRYDRPQVNDGSPARLFPPERVLGYSDASYTQSPNRYAADWTLLRRVTLLAQPNSTELNLPPDGAGSIWSDLNLQRYEAFDSEIQIGAQPAASSAFTTLAAFFPRDYPFPRDYVRAAKGGDRDRYPAISSGLVDIATTDLAEIRRTIMDAAEYPWNINGELDFFDPGPPVTGLFDDEFNHSGGAGSDLRFMHAWMDDLFPTNPHPLAPTDPLSGERVRYETQVPDFVGTLSTYTDEKTRNYRFIQNFRLADQRMLGSAVFVPHCTEFIVEYSFGQVVNNDTLPYHGQLIWFGMERELTVDGNTYPVVLPYPYDTTDSTNRIRPYAVPYRRLDGSVGSRVLSRALLYQTPPPAEGEEPDPLTAHFGYIDPTYSPADPDVDPPTVPWAWPKLIRITMTLADPTDPSIEQTFQFIFETPDADTF